MFKTGAGTGEHSNLNRGQDTRADRTGPKTPGGAGTHTRQTQEPHKPTSAGTGGDSRDLTVHVAGTGRPVKKTPGGAGTHTGHTGAHRHTDHTDEPPDRLPKFQTEGALCLEGANPPTHPHDLASRDNRIRGRLGTVLHSSRLAVQFEKGEVREISLFDGTWYIVQYRALAAPPAVTHLPHAPSFRRPPSSRRGEALWERVEAGSGSLGAASSESAAGSGRFRACPAALRMLSRPRFRPSRGRAGVCCVVGFGWL